MKGAFHHSHVYTSQSHYRISLASIKEGNIAENGLLSFAKFVLFPLYALRNNGTSTGLAVKRKPEFGGDVTFTSYATLEETFAAKQLHPGDLKKAVSAAINELLEPIRQRWAADPALQKLTEASYPSAVSAPVVGKKPKGGNPNGNASTAPANTAEDLSRVELRVGKILSVARHPDADALYVEQVDCGDGDGKIRTVVSGLVKHFSEAELSGRMVVLMCNLKPSKLRGITSEAMVMCASNASGDVVELLEPPASALIGERVIAPGFDQGAPDAVLNASKAKFFQAVLDALKTDEARVATYQGVALQTQKGGDALTVKSLTNAHIR